MHTVQYKQIVTKTFQASVGVWCQFSIIWSDFNKLMTITDVGSWFQDVRGSYRTPSVFSRVRGKPLTEVLSLWGPLHDYVSVWEEPQTEKASRSRQNLGIRPNAELTAWLWSGWSPLEHHWGLVLPLRCSWIPGWGQTVAELSAGFLPASVPEHQGDGPRAPSVSSPSPPGDVPSWSPIPCRQGQNVATS